MQPLTGVLVLDFTTLLPGPLATLLLAEAGAEVVKIERPGGEDMRHYEPRFDGESAMFSLLNRGKQSLVLDLKRQSDRDKLTRNALRERNCDTSIHPACRSPRCVSARARRKRVRSQNSTPSIARRAKNASVASHA